MVGIRGEVAAPGKKLEETGFTRAEVLGGRKDKASQKPGRLLCQSLTQLPSPPTLASSLMDQTKREHPQTPWSCLCFYQTQVQPCPTPPLPLITLWCLEADRGHPAGARCCRPKLNDGTQGPWARPLGLRLGPVQWGTKQKRWLGPQELGRGVAVEPGSCLWGLLRTGGQAHLRGYSQQSQVWG